MIVKNVLIGWKYTVDEVTEEYSVNGDLLSLRNRSGLTHTLVYDLPIAEGGDQYDYTLDRIIGPFGEYISLTNDPSSGNALYRTMIDPAGNIYRYEYDANINLTSISYPDETPLDSNDNLTRVYHYEDNNFIHALTGITNENGNRVRTWAYDKQKVELSPAQVSVMK